MTTTSHDIDIDIDIDIDARDPLADDLPQARRRRQAHAERPAGVLNKTGSSGESGDPGPRSTRAHDKREAMSAGEVVRDGVGVAYRVSGAGPDVALLPAWQLIDSRMWDPQVAALSGSARVITHDARGSGRSGRPAGEASYAAPELVADAVAVLDAVGSERAVLVGQSMGGALALMLAALHPHRVAGLVLVGPTVNLTGQADAPFVAAGLRFEQDRGPGEQGWDRYNRHAWRRDFPGFVRWFVDTAAPEPHLGALRAQAVAWALEHDPEALATVTAARAMVSPRQQTALLGSLAEQVRCPAVVIHGDRDAIVPPAWGATLAQRLHAEHVVVPGAGHCPHLSAPDVVATAVAGMTQGNTR